MARFVDARWPLSLVLACAACGPGASGAPPTDAACAAGFTGPGCATNIDDCAATPCRNGGACTDGLATSTCACPPGFAGDRCELATWRFDAAPTRALDLLFVIDDSGSMAAEQARLVSAFDDLLAALATPGGDLPDLHVGVVSSNVGAAGAAGVPGCAGAGDDGTLRATDTANGGVACPGMTATYAADASDGAGGRDRNYAGALTDVFACMATLGTSGCGFEMHLESAWRALQTGKNPGFLRDDARLAVVVLADEDDCSTEGGAMFADPTADLTSALGPRTSFRCHEFGVVCEDDPNPRAFGTKTGCRARADSPYQFELARYTSFFTQLKPDPALVSVAGIVGPFGGQLTVGQDPSAAAPPNQPAVQRSCGFDPTDDQVGASPPVRLSEFLRGFTDRHAEASICDASFSDALTALGAQLTAKLSASRCIDAPLVEPLQCTVRYVTDPDGPARQERELPRCAVGGDTPCWDLDANPTACPDSTDELRIVPGAERFADDGVIEAACRTA